MKKIRLHQIYLIFLISCLFAIYAHLSAGKAFAQVATLSLSPATGTFNRGCTFSLDITLDTGGAPTDGTDAILFYDPTRFTATSIQSGTVYSDYPGNNIDTQQGKVTTSGLASVSSAFTGKGTFATVNFSVLDNAPTGSTQIKFDFDPTNKGKTTDSNVVQRGSMADILNSVTDGNYVVGSGACGSNIIPVGGPESTLSSTLVTTPAVVITNPPARLAQTGSSQTTVILATIGGMLTVLGVLGLILL